MKPPPADLRIDREGRWFANGRPVIHEKILKLFRESLVRDGDRYFIRIGDEENPVIVEDKPFCVRRLFVENTADGLDIIWLVLNDGRTVALDPETLRATGCDSLCCGIPGTDLEAGFSREAFTQIGGLFALDPDSKTYYLELNGRRHPIWRDVD